MKTQEVQQAIYIALWENIEGITSYNQARLYWNYLNSRATASEKRYAWEKAGLSAILALAD